MITHKMTLGDFDRWIEALESGEYKQGKKQLCKESRNGSVVFCCLGVDVDVNVDTYWEERRSGWWSAGGDPAITNVVFPCDQQELSRRLCSAFRLGTLRNNLSPSRLLARANDAGFTFKRIAAVLKANRAWIYDLEGKC